MRDGYIATVIGIAIGAAVFGFTARSASPDDDQQNRFKTYKVNAVDEVTTATRLFRLFPEGVPILPPTPPRTANYPQTLIWSVELKQPHLQIARRYSPVPAVDAPPISADNSEAALQLYISGQHGGEMTRYLSNLSPGSELEVRGPFVEYETAEPLQQLLLIAGGTGIAPLLQAADRALQMPDCRVQILWANRYSDACVGAGVEPPIRSFAILDYLKGITAVLRSEVRPVSQAEAIRLVTNLNCLQEQYPGRLTVRYFVDEEKSHISASTIRSSLERAAVSTRSYSGRPTGRQLIMVCGSDGFVEHIAGPKPAIGQGPLGGLLAQAEVIRQGWSVWKLG